MNATVRTAITILATTLFFVVLLCFCLDDAFAQRQRRRTAPSTRANPAVDYSRFSHATTKHQSACNTCHNAPTENWKKVRDFPDVADYPGHDACVSCHRPQFFKGARPTICTVCHTAVSPRHDVRFAFANPASPRQFVIEFPHDKHQDVIARRAPRPPLVHSFALASLSSLDSPAGARHALPVAWVRMDAQAKHYNNCEICHLPRMTAPPPPPGGWPDAFVPEPTSFKSAPMGHAACFNCHWAAQETVSK